MRKKALIAAILSMMFFGLLSSAAEPATADVYVPPGPWWDMSEWISPTLFVVDTQDMMPIGWTYSDGPMYDSQGFITGEPQGRIEKIEKSQPWVPFGIDRTVIPFSTDVIVFGWIPGVSVSPDQVPPPIVLVITWNGVPYTVTLDLNKHPYEGNPRIVGWEYPPTLYPDIEDVYPFSYPYEPEAPFKTVYWNIWVGDGNWLVEQFTGAPPPEGEVFPYGYYFWYVFHPNVGDWIGYNCVGETKHPPTYDVTALFEYRTVQIWFWHVAFDVRFLEIHEEIIPDRIFPPTTQSISKELIIRNVGKVPAHGLDIWQTFPHHPKKRVVPVWDTATIEIIDGRDIGPLEMPEDFGRTPWPYELPSDYYGQDLSILYPGETMIIRMDLVATIPQAGRIVFFGNDMLRDAHINEANNRLVANQAIDYLAGRVDLHGIDILYDLRHGERDTGELSILLGDAVARGATVSYNLALVTPAVLAPFEILIINEWDNIAWTPAEVLAVRLWVNNGGSIFFNGDEIGPSMVLANAYGINYGPPAIAGPTSNIVPHPITTGASVMTVPNPLVSLITVGPAYPIVFDSGGVAAVVGVADIWWSGTFVFDAMVSAHEIPPWKWPRSMDGLLVGTPFGEEGEFLWTGWKLLEDWDSPTGYSFTLVEEWFVPGPINRNPLPPQDAYEFEMPLDPIPVDLTGDGVIDEADIELVRLAVVGLVPYKVEMDVNANGKVDAYDLASYKLAAS